MRKLTLPGMLAVAALAAVGCNPTVDDDASAVSMFTTLSPEGSIGLSGLFSDVVEDDGSPVDDTVTITVRSERKSTAQTTSPFYTIDLQGYQVVFSRLDGKNEPGVDVPFPFTLAIAGSIPPGGNTNVEILLVTKQQKLEPPLRTLWFLENERINSTAHVTVFGRDRVKNDLSSTASLPVIFGDF